MWKRESSQTPLWTLYQIETSVVPSAPKGRRYFYLWRSYSSERLSNVSMVIQLGSRRGGMKLRTQSVSKIYGLSTVSWYLRLWQICNYSTWCIGTMDTWAISSCSVTHTTHFLSNIVSNGFQDQSLLITTQVWQWLEQQMSIISQQYQPFTRNVKVWDDSSQRPLFSQEGWELTNSVLQTHWEIYKASRFLFWRVWETGGRGKSFR